MSKLVNIFFSYAPTMGYVFRSGRVIHFIGGQFTTTNQAEIDELNEVCAEAGSNYYLKDDQLTVDSTQLDPMAVLYAKMMEKARAEVAAATNPNRPMGETSFDGLKGIANSNTVRGLVADSSASMTDSPTTESAPAKVGVAAGSIKVATATKV